MITQHLRRNVVAYLALFVALSTGAAYAAAAIADGSVTTQKLAENAVTSPKIKKNAVKSADVKNGSLTVTDLKDGVIWVGGKTMYDGLNPVAAPDSGLLDAYSFTLPRAGTLQVTLSSYGMEGNCSSGPGHVGLYLDGDRIPRTRLPIGPNPLAVGTVGLAVATAGPHTVTHGYNCPRGNIIYYDPSLNYYTLVLGE